MSPDSANVTSWRHSPSVLFAVLFGINVLNYTDRFVLPAVASELKLDLGLTNEQIGLLGTAFLLVYAVAAIPAGTIADRLRRTRLIAAGVAVWSVATLFTGITRSFGQLFAARALLGIGEATYFPASTTLLADSFPIHRRGRLMSWWGTATLVGVFLGFAVGGIVGGRFGWRAAFYVTALPGLILAIVVALLWEPRRGTSERLDATDDGASNLSAIRQILGVRSLVASIVAQALSFFVLGGVSFWIPLYMAQHFGQDTAQAGILSGGVIVVGGGLGTLAGGYTADALLARGVASGRLLVPAVGYLLSAPFVLLALLTGSLVDFLAFMFLSAAFLQVSNGPLSALSQDVIIPARRARAVAVGLLLTHVFGDAFAPVALGSLSDVFGNLQQALQVTAPTVVAAAIAAAVGCRWVGADRQKVLRQASLENAGVGK